MKNLASRKIWFGPGLAGAFVTMSLFTAACSKTESLGTHDEAIDGGDVPTAGGAPNAAGGSSAAGDDSAGGASSTGGASGGTVGSGGSAGAGARGGGGSGGAAPECIDGEVVTSNDCNTCGCSNGRVFCTTKGCASCGPTMGDTCGADEYCYFPPSDACGDTGAVGVCARRAIDDCAAPPVLVCGCDGVTYADACRAKAAGVAFRSTEPCPDAG